MDMSFFSRLFGGAGDTENNAGSACVAKNRLLIEKKRAELSGIEKDIVSALTEALPKDKKLAGTSFDLSIGDRENEIRIVFNADISAKAVGENSSEEEFSLEMVKRKSAKTRKGKRSISPAEADYSPRTWG